MTVKKVFFAVTAILALLALGATSASASPCEGCTPWWHVTASARPTDLWTATTPEVQEVNAGLVTVLEVEGKFVACVGAAGESFCEALTGHRYTATAVELQAELEAAYGISGVEVTEPTAGTYKVQAPGHFAPGLEVGEYEIPPAYQSVVKSSAELAGSVSVQGGSGEMVITAANLGDAPASGCTKVAAGTGKYTGSGCTTGQLGPGEYEATPIKIADDLPQGVTGLKVEGVAGMTETESRGPVQCTQPAGPCTFKGELSPYESIELTVHVALSGTPPIAGAPGEVTAAGGGAASVSVPQPLHVGEHTPFGVEHYEAVLEAEGGGADTQAGSHPFQFTTTLDLNQGALSASNHATTLEQQPALPRGFQFHLPPGLVGNATLTPKCSEAQFTATVEFVASECPADTAVGAATVTIIEHAHLGLTTIAEPVFNLVTEKGEPARFGFIAVGVPVILDTSLRSGEDYGVTVSIANTTQAAQLLASTVSFWGVPDDPRHNESRGAACVFQAYPVAARLGPCQTPEHPAVLPFLTLPASCTGALSFPMGLESWNGLTPLAEPFTGTALDGCNRVPFEPRIEVAPDVQSSSSASGLTAHVRLPQAISEDPNSPGEGTIKDTTIALPAGVGLNPSDSDGLEACSESQIGYLNKQGPSGELEFTGTLPAGWEEGDGGFCPKASKIGTVSIVTPLLKEPVKGAVYLATPAPNGEAGQNPFNSLLTMYIVAENGEAGVAVKLPGKVGLCERAGQVIEGIACGAQGQLISTFADTPQLPFEDLELHFFGGERSPLSTPTHCGSYTTQAMFTPWSDGEPVQSTSTFAVTSGPHGSACPGVLPFEPSLATGTTNNNAGGFSPFTTTIGREDGNENLQAVELKMPPGLSGILSGVALCGEAQADAGTCGPNSQVGETTVSVGVGNEPYTVTGGKVYLTGPYEGAPFGLSIVNPANAGPFHLGNVIVRAKIEVNPQTAALTVTSDNSGAYKIPQFIDGLPLQIKHINVTVGEDNKFTFNPTSCAHMAIEGRLYSTEGASHALSVPFQATNCASLKFEPKFAVATSGKTSKADGASLTAKLSEPNVPAGTDANIAKVKVELPKQLPSRLTTLQKACTAAQFEANPAGCPSESKIGDATVHTPLVPVPLTGPAIFVSHGGEAFPSLTIVLQGYGVTVDLVGTTFISKAGITSTTFKTVPDVPFNSFELTLPDGPYSALATNLPHESHDLCGQRLTMPTEFIAQNGAAIHESTAISTTGCKPAITVVSHKVKGKTATIVVSVPAAGKLVATAKGLSKASKTAKGATTVTMKLTLTNAEAAALSKHKGRKLKGKINLTFTPKKGGKLKTTTTVLID
jgi:hypothetical protein